MYDLAIIGSGPAGLSAAVSAAQRNKSAVILGREISAGLLYAAEKVDNYPGLPEQSGREMLEAFFEHAMKKGAEYKECKVSQIINMGSSFSISAGDDFVEAKTVILALGVDKGREIAGEAAFLGKGVSHCATCDGMLYRNKTVAVIGDNAEGEEEADYLADICSKVYYIPKYKTVGKLKAGIEVVTAKPLEVTGDGIVSGLLTDKGEIKCDGVFFAKAVIPAKSLIFGLNTENGKILTGRGMETNIAGVYAAGDCTGAPYQVAKAVGEGQIAALSAAGYIERNK